MRLERDNYRELILNKRRISSFECDIAEKIDFPDNKLVIKLGTVFLVELVEFDPVVVAIQTL